jgi:hypothetical protein
MIVDKLDRALSSGVDRREPPSPSELAAAAELSARERGTLLRALAHEPIGELAARIAAVRRWRDPRVVMAATGVLRRPRKLGAVDEPGLDAVESLLGDEGDRRVLTAIGAARSWQAPGWLAPDIFVKRMTPLRARIEARLGREIAVDDDARALMARIFAWSRERRNWPRWALRMSSAERRFWRLLETDPIDPTLPVVLADELVAAGDPRGELIVRAARGEEIADAQLEAAWLKPIASWIVPGSARFRGGMLDAVRLRPAARVLFDHGVWRTPNRRARPVIVTTRSSVARGNRVRTTSSSVASSSLPTRSHVSTTIAPVGRYSAPLEVRPWVVAAT